MVLADSGARPWREQLLVLRRELEPSLFAFLVAAGLALGYITFTKLGNSFSPGASQTGFSGLLVLDLVVLVLLTLLLISRFVRSLGGLSVAKAGRRLLFRMVTFFTLIAALPIAVITAISVLLINIGLQTWFAQPVSTAISGSNLIADVYLEERRQSANTDAQIFAAALRDSSELATLDVEGLENMMQETAFSTGLSELLLIEIEPRPFGQATIRHAEFGVTFEREVEISYLDLERANLGETVSLREQTADRVSVLLKPNLQLPYYLFVAKSVDPVVLDRVQQTREAASTYSALEESAGDMQQNALMIFGVISAALIICAASMGLFFAASISAPISWLLHASNKVGAGELDIALPQERTGQSDEFSRLMQAFARMANQLQQQRQTLLGVNQQLDQRRRFTEAVLTGVSAGVVGLDGEGRITLANRSSQDLLGFDLSENRQENFVQLVPEFASLMEEALVSDGKLEDQEVSLVNKKLNRLRLKATIVVERKEGRIQGYVLTFDDVTELVDAQKSAAWSDVARRVAHEIKNPLTPIQLSAERLKRRYRKQLTDGLETFDLCTDTIIRQVDDIRTMVDEFSSFARSNEPKFQLNDLGKLANQAIFLESQAYPHIKYDFKRPETPIEARVDARLMNQALLNILRNAAEAITETPESERGEKPTISLYLKLSEEHRLVTFEVLDTGPGLPAGKEASLTDPYVTFKEKGTGLGLAIVNKIISDHGGKLSIKNRTDGIVGAAVTIALPKLVRASKTQTGLEVLDPDQDDNPSVGA